jgi:hypothetical protein
VGGLSLLIADLLVLANPWIMKTAIDALSRGITKRELLTTPGLVVLLTLVGGVFRFFMRRIMIGVSRRIEVDMRADFPAPPAVLSPSFYHRHRTGELMALATNDLKRGAHTGRACGDVLHEHRGHRHHVDHPDDDALVEAHGGGAGTDGGDGRGRLLQCQGDPPSL